MNFPPGKSRRKSELPWLAMGWGMPTLPQLLCQEAERPQDGDSPATNITLLKRFGLLRTEEGGVGCLTSEQLLEVFQHTLCGIVATHAMHAGARVSIAGTEIQASKRHSVTE